MPSTMVTCTKPWAGFMLNLLYPKVHFCPKSSLPLSKSRLNLAKMWLFASPIQDTTQKCSCWPKIVNHCDKCDNGVMQTGKEIKSGFKKIRTKTDVARHTCKLLSRKTDEHLDINTLLLYIAVK